MSYDTLSTDAALPLQITGDEYGAFEHAYDWFNARLFAGALPPVLITLQRHSRMKGFFAPERFGHRALAGTATHELALNPDSFEARSDIDILSTLVHEMAHCWQQHYGTPPRRSYHNAEWATQMRALGLMPSQTGEPGGKQTGQGMSHYILEDGPFADAAAQLLATGFALHWQSTWPEALRIAKRRSKTKYTCPQCDQNAWAKPDAALLCGVCEVPLEPEA